MIQPVRTSDNAGEGPVVPIRFPAEVDITNSEVIGKALLAAFRPGVSAVIADLSTTEFCDSSGIRYLIIARNRAARAGTDFRVVIGSVAVRRALHVAEADQLLRLYPDMHSALAAGPSGARDGE